MKRPPRVLPSAPEAFIKGDQGGKPMTQQQRVNVRADIAAALLQQMTVYNAPVNDVVTAQVDVLVETLQSLGKTKQTIARLVAEEIVKRVV